jgi:DsbC/DsbD-like thiol-disulfide interchange protein
MPAAHGFSYNDGMGPMIVAAWLLQAIANPQSTAHLQVKTSASAAAVAAGGTVTLQVDVTPKPKMHVYAPGQDGYIPIQLTLTADPAFTAAKAKYPAGETFVMPALNERQLVYAKPFRITQAVTLAPSATGPVTIKGTLRYQACDDTICYLPKTIPLDWTVLVK